MYSFRVAVHLVTHPVAQDALVTLRDARTPPAAFRRAARRISTILAAEALATVPTVETTVETPLETTSGRTVVGDVIVVPVLRAGLGMLDAVLELLPAARVGYLGLQRDEVTAVASRYYSKLPEGLDASFVLMIDPMLATGGSARRRARPARCGRAPGTSASSASSPRRKGSPRSRPAIPTWKSTRRRSTAS